MYKTITIRGVITMENILSKKQKKHLKKTYLNTERKIRNSISSNRKGFYCGIAVLAVLTAYSLLKPKEQQAVIPQVNQDYESCMSWNRSNSINRKQYLSPVQINGNDSNLLIVFYVQIMPDDFVMQLHRF